MSDSETPLVAHGFWVTRNRRADVEQLPHPDAYDEWIKGKPTGRMKKTAWNGETFIGTLDEIEDWLSTMPTEMIVKAAALHRDLFEQGQERIRQKEDEHKAREAAREKLRIRHSGLKRNLREETRLSTYIEKFQKGSTLTDKELRFLLQYYGIMIRMCEMSGQRYYLAQTDALQQHEKLREIANRRGWSQAILNVYGVMVEGVFERIA